MKALVIGGSGSIGTAIVDRLLDEGYEVIIHYNTADLTSLKEKYKNNNVEFINVI